MSPWLLLLLVGGLLQTSLFGRFSIFGVHPNLLLVLVISWTLLRGGREGMVWGVVGGFVMDTLSSAPFGTFTVSMLVTAFVAGLVEGTLFRPTIFLPVGIMLLVSPLFQLIAIVMMQSLGWELTWGETLYLLPRAALFDSLLMILVFPFMRRVNVLAGVRDIEWRR